MCFRPPSLPIGRVAALVMPFCVSHTIQSALERGQDSRIVQIHFSAALTGSMSQN